MSEPPNKKRTSNQSSSSKRGQRAAKSSSQGRVHDRSKVANSEENPCDGDEKFELFWQRDSPFSQHHYCQFTIDNITYNCAEQYMMYSKAITFGDKESAEKILKSTQPDEQKKLGRQVKGYEEETWNSVCCKIVKAANMAKFSQNDSLRQQLFNTAGRTLVEASPFDRKWGIGLGASNPKALDRKSWRGTNLLGQILTEVREELMKGDSCGGETSVAVGGCLPTSMGVSWSIKEVSVSNTESEDSSFLSASGHEVSDANQTGASAGTTTVTCPMSSFHQSSRNKNASHLHSRQSVSRTASQSHDTKTVSDESENVLTFWGFESPFSEHHPCQFTVDGVQYNCAKQYVAHQKALKFGDMSTAAEVMKCKLAAEMKNLGHCVLNFNRDTWQDICRGITKTANNAKFSQNEHLKDELLKTVGKILVESKSKRPPKNVTSNPGTNRLGEILAEIRNELMEETKKHGVELMQQASSHSDELMEQSSSHHDEVFNDGSTEILDEEVKVKQ